MPILNLLLIEDTPTDAALFCDRIQNELGEVEITWKTTIDAAKKWIKAGNEPDQVWLDPSLPDLNQEDLGRVLAQLKEMLHPWSGELKMLGSPSCTSAVSQQARRHKVDVFEKDGLRSSNSEILEVVRELLAKRSSGTVSKTLHIQLERTVARTEGLAEENAKRLDKLEGGLEKLSSLSFEINSIKGLLAPIPQLTQDVAELKRTQQLDSKRKEESVQVRIARWTVIGGVIVALAGGAVTLAQTVVNKWFEHPKENKGGKL